ncbi:MAG TPA: hypothetical protein VFD48_10250 [Pyrinomonadaceae bacterium]|nr:hypothetical protein [Pyrinomonadaceae bacterium]
MLISIALIISLLQLMSLREALTKTAGRANTTRSLGVQKQVNSVWHPAVYNGLTIGRSTREDMIRVFGEPKSSEVFDGGKGPPEQWFHYESGGEFPGELVFNVDRKTGVIARLILHPTKLSKEEAIKHFGENYKLTRYEFCKGFEDEDSAPVYETPTGQFQTVEYRAKGIAVAIGDKDEVEYISYVSEPLGSKCKR